MALWGQGGSDRISHGEPLVPPGSGVAWGACWGLQGAPGAPQSRRGWPVPCNNYTVPLCQLVGLRPLSTEDTENARLQEGKRKMRSEGGEPWFPHVEQGL